MVAEKAKKTPEQKEEDIDCIKLAVVDAPVNMEVSRNFKSKLIHAKHLSEWDKVLLSGIFLLVMWPCTCT